MPVRDGSDTSGRFGCLAFEKIIGQKKAMNAPFDNPLRMLRQLKGAPLSVYLACQIVRQVVSRDWLCEQTGYSDNAVTRALGYLTEHNYLARVTGGWMIAAGAIQLPLMAALPAPDGDGDDLVLEKRDYRAFENKKREKRVFPSSVVVVDELFSEVPTITTTTTTTRDEKREKRVFHSQSDSSQDRDPAEWAALKLALDEYQIIGPKRKALIACEWVSGEYVRAHVKYAKGENANWDNPVGMAINRMLDGLDAPENDNTKKIYKTVTVDNGKRGITTINYTFDVDQAAADFTGHEKGCRCLDCTVYRTAGERALCPNCKRHNCECPEEEGE